ncbi:MAG: hypothetical protein LBS97_04410 [Treponema sp.]|jgi:O-glycosyl hydrolase|nr:hypothetical protein [Treponema sp.]
MHKLSKLIICLTAPAALLIGCVSGAPKQNGGTIHVDFDAPRQTIDGFGGSNAWLTLPADPAGAEVVKLLYSKTEGIGLTILRNRIPFREHHKNEDGTEHDDAFINRNSNDTYIFSETGGVKTFDLNWDNWDLQNTKTLIARIKALDGAPEKLVMFSAPWTAPNNSAMRWKPDVKNWDTPDVGGHLDTARYADYGDLLADYVNGFEAALGIPLDVLSVQNEPNWEPNYESTKWNGEQLRDFIKVLGKRLALKNAVVQVMAPEDENLKEDMVKPILADSEAAEILSIVGLHQYEGAYDESGKAGAEPMPTVWESGKRLWQTEVSGIGPKMPRGDGIENALFYGRMIHYDMTLAETNAYLFWWLWENGKKTSLGSLIQINNEGVVNDTTRMYVLGQYSRFIRPGWARVTSDTEPLPDVFASAYRSPESTEAALVLVNDTDTEVNLKLDFGGKKFSAYDFYRTSETEKLQKIKTAKSAGSVSLAPRSVTTIYGH